MITTVVAISVLSLRPNDRSLGRTPAYRDAACTVVVGALSGQRPTPSGRSSFATRMLALALLVAAATATTAAWVLLRRRRARQAGLAAPPLHITGAGVHHLAS